MAKGKKSTSRARKTSASRTIPLYTLEVELMGCTKKNRVSRTIQIKGNQTLDDLHNAIFDAYDRYDEHMYEFQFGTKPHDPEAKRYVIRDPYGFDYGEEPAGAVDETTIDSLGLEKGARFFYWFDFGDDWWHKITVTGIEKEAPAGKYPRVTAAVGKSPPQYAYDDEEE